MFGESQLDQQIALSVSALVDDSEPELYRPTLL